MGKWIKGRPKRGQKRGSGSSEQGKAPEPLQPKYFEADVGEKPAAEMAPPPPRAPEPPEPQPQPEGEPATVTSTVEGGRPLRRRRRRGGRGGGPRPGIDNVTRGLSDEVPGAPASEGAVVSDTSSVPGNVAAVPIDTASPDTVAAELPPTAAPAAKPRPSKGVVVLAIGLPGSGKSSWFKRHSIRPLSSDLLRELLFDDAEEQRFQDLVFSNLRSMLKARLIARRPLSYIDATNLNPHDRHSWIKLAKDYGYDVQGLFFDVPLEVCLERHARRGRVVPEDIMRKMAAKLKAPTFDEGFSKITVVRVKKKE